MDSDSADQASAPKAEPASLDRFGELVQSPWQRAAGSPFPGKDDGPPRARANLSFTMISYVADRG